MVESSVYIFYNFFHNHWKHGVFVTSLVIAIIYLVIQFIGVIYVLLTPLTFDKFEEEQQ